MKALHKELMQIPGVGPHKAKLLARSGVRSLADLAERSEEELLALPSVGPHLASVMRAHADALAPGKEAAARAAAPGSSDSGLLRRLQSGASRRLENVRRCFETAAVSVGDRCFALLGA